MELVVQILMLFIVVGTAVRLSFERVWVSLLFGLAAAAFVYLTYSPCDRADQDWASRLHR